MTSDELTAFLESKGIATRYKVIVDDHYDLPDKQQLFGEFADDYWKNLQSLGLTNYSTDRNDCDKFSLYLMAMAKMAHGLSTDRSTGIAIGMIGYEQNALNSLPVPHSIACAVVNVNNERQLAFFEGQYPPREVLLSDDEIQSIFFLYI